MNPLLMTSQTIRIAGHRGYAAGAPENTLAAFKKARELGGEGVVCETDLALTGDGELVLIHDETVDRTTDGHGLVQSMTYSEIAKLDAGRWFGVEFAGEIVPRLRDALQLARELGIIYQVELKIYDRNDELFPKLRLLINELGCADLLRFSSFDFVQLREFPSGELFNSMRLVLQPLYIFRVVRYLKKSSLMVVWICMLRLFSGFAKGSLIRFSATM